jgi:uncharacterized protein
MVYYIYIEYIMLDPKTTLTILTGSIAGFFAGGLGQSGAETMLPLLLIFGIVPNHKTAAGTILMSFVAPMSLLAALEYYKMGQVNMKAAIILCITYFFVAFIGARLTKSVSNRTLDMITGYYLLIISIFFFWNSYTGTYGYGK